jgi:hypothetical protein
MNSFTKLFDSYDLKARLSPALLVFAPFLVVLMCKYGPKATIGLAITSFLITCGALFWLARWARTAGIAVQNKAWEPWRGSPTIRYLRYRESKLDPITIERFHGVLAAGIGKTFPTAAEEAADPEGADNLYRSGVKWLMEQTREPKKYAHLLKENIAYGFHRNMLGVKPVGIALSVTSSLVALFWSGLLNFNAPYVDVSRISGFSLEQITAVLLPLVALMLWIFAVTPVSMEHASNAYSERLLQACEGMVKLPMKKSVKTKTNEREAGDAA